MSERDKTAAVKRNSPAREIWRRFKKNKAAMLGLGIFSVMVLLAVFADVGVMIIAVLNAIRALFVKNL